MKADQQRRIRYWWHLAAGLALLLQSLFPSGYMPGNADSGWIAVLCPEGLPPAFAKSLAGEHHHHHQGGEHMAADDGDSGYDDCQLGSAFDQSTDLAAVSLESVSVSSDSVTSVSTLSLITASDLRLPPSRAPPIS